MVARLPPFVRSVILAPVLGALGACGFQPLGLWPLTLLALAGLLELAFRAKGWKAAAMLGWLWGVGHFCAGNNWIATAFTYQANMPAWLGGVAVFLLSLYLAIFPALAATGAWFARGSRLALPLAFAGCWILGEFLRGWLFTGFPWNPLAVAALGGFHAPGVAQIAAFTGTYGLSGIVAGLAGCWWLAVRDWPSHKRRAAALVLVPAALMLPFGALAPREEGRLPYTLVQPNISQPELENPALYAAQFRRFAALSQPLQPGQRRILLWPESSLPDFLREGYPNYVYAQTTYEADPLASRARIAQAIGPGTTLLMGSVDLEMAKGTPSAARNVVTVLDEQGAIRASYAKAHLVPYGEYLPMREWLSLIGLSRLVPGELDFHPGPGPRTLDLGEWGRAGVQICYEIVFSGHVADPAHRPDFIFNPSNDGWFGSWGPPQHLAQARLRAIEEGLPVLRSTTTGISAVVDADGVVRQFIPRHAAGRLDGMVPPAHAPTLFAWAGNAIALAIAVVFLGCALLAMRRRAG